MTNTMTSPRANEANENEGFLPQLTRGIPANQGILEGTGMMSHDTIASHMCLAADVSEGK